MLTYDETELRIAQIAATLLSGNPHYQAAGDHWSDGQREEMFDEAVRDAFKLANMAREG